MFCIMNQQSVSETSDLSAEAKSESSSSAIISQVTDAVE